MTDGNEDGIENQVNALFSQPLTAARIKETSGFSLRGVIQIDEEGYVVPELREQYEILRDLFGEANVQFMQFTDGVGDTQIGLFVRPVDPPEIEPSA
jgi:hypothetical protein